MKRRTALLLAGTIIATWPLISHAADAVDWSSELGKHEGTTLRILMIQDPWISALPVLNPAFEKITGAKVVFDAFGYDQTHEKQVLEGTSQSSQYDIIVLDSPWVGEFYSGDFVENLTPYIEKTKPEVIEWDDFVPAFQEVAKWEDQIIGVPFGAYFMMMHYRKDLFEKAGLKPPVTIDDYKAAAKHFTNNPDFPGVYGTALNNARGAPIGQSFFEWIYNFGGRPFANMTPGHEDVYGDMTPKFNAPEATEVFQFFKDMLAYQPPGAESIAWEERAATFTTGKTAMITAWSARTPGFFDPTKSQIADKIGTTVFPHKEGIDGTPPLGGWVMGINKHSNQKDLAWDYIKWFTSKDVHRQFVLLGGPPSRMSSINDPEILEKQPWVATIGETVKHVFADCRPRIPESFEIIDTVGFQFSRAIQNQASVAEALGTLQTTLADLMVKGGYTVQQ